MEFFFHAADNQCLVVFFFVGGLLIVNIYDTFETIVGHIFKNNMKNLIIVVLLVAITGFLHFANAQCPVGCTVITPGQTTFTQGVSYCIPAGATVIGTVSAGSTILDDVDICIGDGASWHFRGSLLFRQQHPAFGIPPSSFTIGDDASVTIEGSLTADATNLFDPINMDIVIGSSSVFEVCGAITMNNNDILSDPGSMLITRGSIGSADSPPASGNAGIVDNDLYWIALGPETINNRNPDCGPNAANEPDCGGTPWPTGFSSAITDCGQALAIRDGLASCALNTPSVRTEYDDNGTPSIPGDDRFQYYITVTGTDVGASYSISGDDTQSGLAYAVEQGPFGFFSISGGNLSLTITDVDDSDCTITVTVTAPPVSPPPVPTIGQWGLIVLGLLVLSMGGIAIRNRRVRNAVGGLVE